MLRVLINILAANGLERQRGSDWLRLAVECWGSSGTSHSHFSHLADSLIQSDEGKVLCSRAQIFPLAGSGIQTSDFSYWPKVPTGLPAPIIPRWVFPFSSNNVQ